MWGVVLSETTVLVYLDTADPVFVTFTSLSGFVCAGAASVAAAVREQ